MANKIYDFLPAHLQNKELEDIFDSTLERVFSKGSLEKKRAFVGRREKGLTNDDNNYLDFPKHLFQRDNYGLEPVFSNDAISDRVFYDDLLNSMFNKGMLVNDHRRLFKTVRNTINLPIDADKFVNWQMYYWVKPGFFTDGRQSSEYVHYITMDKGDTDWWSTNNSWYHYDDIRYSITDTNRQFIEQAKRPIIEFDHKLELVNGVSNNVWEKPMFKLYEYDENNDIQPLSDTYSIFEYAEDELFAVDSLLKIPAKLKSGDYNSEFVFKITMPEGSYYKLGADLVNLYIKSEFNYRNLRKEYGKGNYTKLELPMVPYTNNDIDVYVDGLKQIGNYTVFNTTVTFDEEVSGDVYADIATKYNVNIDGDDVWQRVDPILEYNIDNEAHNLAELTYSVFFEHFVRQIETVSGLVGEANASNNYRLLGDNSNKIRFNKYGSVIVTHNTDVRKGYFSITRDDFDPIKSLEFIASSYSNYKNKIVLTVREILSDDASNSKTDLQILEEAISSITLNKKSGIDVFSGSDMFVMGTLYNNYVVGQIDVTVGGNEHRIPSEISSTAVLNPENSMVLLNGELQLYDVDYVITDPLFITFKNKIANENDEIYIRYYTSIQETFMPPSAVKLGIASKHVPVKFVDTEYDTPVEFIKGHDGSCTPTWGDRTDDILLMLEKLIYNKTHAATSNKFALKHGFYSQYKSDYTYGEKKYTLFPFFKKWMIKNGIEDTRNTNFDINDWRTWNYRSLNDSAPGSYRGLYSFIYNTEFIFNEPWLVLGKTERPKEELFGWVYDSRYDYTENNETVRGGYFTDVNYKTYNFWVSLKERAGAAWPIPLNSDNSIKDVDRLLFNAKISTDITFNKQTLSQDWEFGDGSPEELAWRRGSEYPFVEFIAMILLTPFSVLDTYDEQITTAVDLFNKREGYGVDSIISQRDGYNFKLGSKLGGFVNNLKVFSERNSLSNSNYSEIPTDNYNLFVHAGEPNRSESFSAIIIEKVALFETYPTYSLFNTDSYVPGEVVYREADEKYYKRKTAGRTQKEINSSDESFFDYNVWSMLSQPNVTKFGYRISGYDDLNPVFYTLAYDKTSSAKTWRTKGDPAILKTWTQGEYYKLDNYVSYNNKPYVALTNHQATDSFDSDLYDGKWKLLKEWPNVNTVQANGFEDLLDDTVKSYNYGDVLTSLDDVAHLMYGYQEYLKIIGWDFTDLDDFSEVVDFETLLIEFLEWTKETHEPGEFITLTPILRTGSFSAPYGVASVGRTNNKNYYRVVDSSGRQLSNSVITFNMTSDGITWESSVPVYGIKVDIQDIEHAMVLNRKDSYGDIIYDPFQHNRNLRILIDCNRTSDWDGTLAVDGYIAAGNKLLPNFDTMIGDTRYYRDTLVDQSLEIVNKLKETQIGFYPRTYLTNHFVERETQLEFYKGFLAGKGTKSSVNRIINKNSNFNDLVHDEIWAFKIDEYGKISKKNATKEISISDIKEDPSIVDFVSSEFELNNSNYRSVPLMTAGYVDPNLVNYIVRNNAILENTVRDTFYEGELAWVRFDEDREWDVKRLNEVAKIQYVGETGDGQLFVGFQTEVANLYDSVFIKIDSIDIDPVINGYYYLVADGARTVETYDLDGNPTETIVYEYLVFDTEYEPLIVEIDSTTDNSTYVPTSEDIGVEAVGSVSNPTFDNGDTIVINGNNYVYTQSENAGASISIGGLSATSNPVITPGREEIGKIEVLDSTGSTINENSYIYFRGTMLEGTTDVSASTGDTVVIDNVTINISNSSEATISVISDNDYMTPIDLGDVFTISVDGGAPEIIALSGLSITGTVSNPSLTSNRDLDINGTTVSFVVPDPIDVSDIVEAFDSQTAPVSSISFTRDMTNYIPGDITVDNGVDTPYTLVNGTDYSYNSSTKTITFNTPIVDGLTDHDGDPLTADQGDGIVDISVALTGVPISQELDLQGIVDTINTAAVPVRAEIATGDFLKLIVDDSYIEMIGGVLVTFGISTTSVYEDSYISQLSEAIHAKSYANSAITSDNRLSITTTSDTIQFGGGIAETLGVDTGVLQSTTAPTAASIASQINSAGITGITASNSLNRLIIQSTKSSMTVTGTDIQTLGFGETVSVTVTSIETIKDDINEALSDVPGTTASIFDNSKILITSTAASITISNYSGNPWDDIGIDTVTYNGDGTVITTAQDFRNQINDVATDVTVSISSDGRMIFISPSVALSFIGTDDTILNRVGLFSTYSSTVSNTNFKVMRWHSVRYTPLHTHGSEEEWLANLGIAQSSLIWSDNYGDLDEGWAVFEYNPTGANVVKNKQVKNTVNVDNIKRMILQDNETFHNYQLYDPLNLKLPGEIVKDVDYIDWSDPAKYDDEYSNDIWLSEHVGDIWWDTRTARYYRYNDYGNANGQIDETYAKRFWGKIVPGSTVTIKQWKSAKAVPADISWFNTETRWDTTLNQRVTTYYFWSEIGIEVTDKEYSISEIKMLLESEGTTNKFLPISDRKIVISNNMLLNSPTVNITVEKVNSSNLVTSHTDWKLIGKNNSVSIDLPYLQGLHNSIVGKNITDVAFVYDGSELKNDMVYDLNISNCAISINNKFVDPLYIDFVKDEVIIDDTVPLYEGDIVRVYKLDELDDIWFSNVRNARMNFASIVNDFLKRKLLVREFPLYNEYIMNGTGIFENINWSIAEKFDVIKSYQYLSKTRNFDMIGMKKKGIDSFKVEIDNSSEYYFDFDGSLRLVHKENGSLYLNYDYTHDGTTEMSPMTQYYENTYSAQTYEIIKMLYEFADKKFIKRMFFDMIDYMYAEGNKPDWIFKTSYIDLFMMNKNLRQYAIYQNDNYDDIIDYVNETKPYHTKIRETERVYPYGETATADVDIYEAMDITLFFGEHSRYKDTTYDGNGSNDLPVNDYEQGGLLRRFNSLTSEEGGYDTGEFDAIFKESMIIRVQAGTALNFYAYDIFGNGYLFETKKIATVTSLTTEQDGSQTLVVQQPSYFRQTKDDTRFIIAVENDNKDLEFIEYNKKTSDGELSINNRGLISGTSIEIEPGQKIYVFATPKKLYDHMDNVLETTLN